MEKREIIAGLKNALERGYSLEIATQSFVNAGYNKQDVSDSATAIGNKQETDLTTQIQQASELQTSIEEKTEEKPLIARKWFIISIAAILIILFGVLAFLIFTKIL